MFFGAWICDGPQQAGIRVNAWGPLERNSGSKRLGFAANVALSYPIDNA